MPPTTGPATELRQAAVSALHNAQWSAVKIAAVLGVDRSTVARDLSANLPAHPGSGSSPPRLAAYVAARVTLSDEHQLWQGRLSARGMPILHGAVRTTGPRAAWYLHHGTWPLGRLSRHCDEPLCIAPGCHDDQAQQQHLRHVLRDVKGWDALPAVCTEGHDQQEHGRLYPDGRRYCKRCLAIQRAQTRARAKHDTTEPTQ